MQKTKAFLRTFLAVLLMTTVSAVWADTFTNGSLTFTYTPGEKVCSVTKCNSLASGRMDIPTSITVNGKTYSVTTIGAYSFYNCTALTSVTIPNSVTTIGSNAFQSCTSLRSIIIPNVVTKIGDAAFMHCSSLTDIAIPNSITAIGYGTFRYCSSLTDITIPNGVTKIGECAFEGCSMTSLIIPNSVATIERLAFVYCTELTEITIPNSVTTIGEEAFRSCYALTSIVVESGNEVYDSREGCNAIIETATNTLISGCKNTIIPNSVTTIGGAAFMECYPLTDIIIPNSVTTIGYSAFNFCTSLTNITIPCSVATIGVYAFYNCSSMTDIYCQNPMPLTLESNLVFQGLYDTVILHVPTGSLAAYQAAEGWKDFKNIVEQEYTIPVTLASLGEGQPNVATFSAPFATTIPNGVKAYAITGTEGGYATTKEIESSVIPANYGVLLASNETAADIVYPSAESTAPAGNKLVATGGTSVAVTPAAGMKAFILANSSKGVGFYPLSTTNNTVPAYRAYLELPDGIASVRINFGDTATDIEAAEVATDTNAPVFDLSGRRVVKPGKPGLYVKGGVKFIVK